MSCTQDEEFAGAANLALSFAFIRKKLTWIFGKTVIEFSRESSVDCCFAGTTAAPLKKGFKIRMVNMEDSVYLSLLRSYAGTVDDNVNRRTVVGGIKNIAQRSVVYMTSVYDTKRIITHACTI